MRYQTVPAYDKEVGKILRGDALATKSFGAAIGRFEGSTFEALQKAGEIEKIRGTRRAMHEYRISLRNRKVRILFHVDESGIAHLLTCFIKTTNAIPENDKRRAESRIP